MSDKTTFLKYMSEEGFSVVANMMGDRWIIPHHYKTPEGDHILISGIRFCMFSGINTPEGGLGCITFYYDGVKRLKYHKTANDTEILEIAECYETPEQAITAYNEWIEKTSKTIASWKVII